MPIFSRGRARRRRAVDEFWTWWASDGRALALAAEDGGDRSRLVREMTKRIGAIGSRLDWEFGPLGSTGHSLTATAGGVPDARTLAQLWWSERPQDSGWSFYPARQPNPDQFTASIEIAGAHVQLTDLGYRITEDPDARRLHVVVVHPGFEGMDPRAALQVAFLSLDWLLGEDDVIRWVGDVTTDAAIIDGAGTRRRLTDSVAELRRQRDPESWQLVEFTMPDGVEYIGMVRDWTRWIDHPVLDTLHQIEIPFEMTPDGMADGEARRLATWEEALERLIAERGIQVVHLSQAGLRTFYVYAPSGDAELTDELSRLARSAPSGRLRTKADPGWSEISVFTR